MPLGTRLSGTLPVSVAVHLLVLGLLLVVPLLADVALPAVVVTTPAYVRTLPVPATPPAARAPSAKAQSSATSSAAAFPVQAPTAIVPERQEDASGPPEIEGGIGTGVWSDVGVIVPETSPVVEAPRTAPRSAVRVAELAQPPRKIVDARPAYPEIARSARVEGTVILEAIIDRDGTIDDVRVIRSVPLLDQAAIDAVRQWRYAPSVLRGQSVAVLITITVNFRLQ